MPDTPFTYSFSGKVLPERADVNLPLPIKALSRGKGKFPTGWEISISIFRSQLAVTVTTEKAVDDLQPMREIVEGIARFSVDALGFLLACGYDVEITQAMGSDPRSHIVFGVDVRGVTPKEQYTREEVFSRFKQIVEVPEGKQQALRRALVDFREAIRSGEDTPFFCFRAIEDVRQLFVVGEDKDVKKTWSEMAQKLALPQETITFVQDTLRPTAISVRHGDIKDIEHAARVEMLSHTWIIIDHFITSETVMPNPTIGRSS